MKIDYEIFISYRHKDCNDLAKALYNEFLNVYGVDAFRDDEELHFGDFREQLIKNNKKSKFLVLLLTPGMLDRCHEEGDWITKEISLYLKSGKPIIPVMMNGFEFPSDLPDEIKGLTEFISNSIICDFNEPIQTAKVIARCVYEKIRYGWSEEKRQSAISNKHYLSKNNKEIKSYYYDSALEFRKCMFYLILNVFYSFCVTRSYFLEHNRDYGIYAFFGIFPLFLLYFEIFLRVDGEKMSLDELLLDNSIKDWIKAFLKAFLIGVIPVIIVSYLIPLASMAGGALVGLSSSDMLEKVYPLAIIMILFYVPLVRWLYKSVLSGIDFFNSLFGRYPTNYLIYETMKKIRKLSKKIGYIILLPTILFCGFVATIVAGGFIFNV